MSIQRYQNQSELKLLIGHLAFTNFTVQNRDGETKNSELFCLPDRRAKSEPTILGMMIDDSVPFFVFLTLFWIRRNLRR